MLDPRCVVSVGQPTVEAGLRTVQVGSEPINAEAVNAVRFSIPATHHSDRTPPTFHTTPTRDVQSFVLDKALRVPAGAEWRGALAAERGSHAFSTASSIVNNARTLTLQLQLQSDVSDFDWCGMLRWRMAPS